MNRPIRSKYNTLFKSIGLVSLITLFSRILGLVREIVKAALLGTSYYSDAFTLAFTIPNLFRRMTAEGAMSSAFIPVFNEILHEEGEKRAFDFAKNFFWLFTMALILFSLLFIISAPWLIRYVFAPGFTSEPQQLTVLLTRYMFIYIVFISLAAILQGVLNSFAVFWISSLTPVLLNISIIGPPALQSNIWICRWGFARGGYPVNGSAARSQKGRSTAFIQDQSRRSKNPTGDHPHTSHDFRYWYLSNQYHCQQFYRINPR